MKYNVSKDIKIVCALLNITYSQLANELRVSRSTITRIVNEETYPSDLLIEQFYSFAYHNSYRDLRLNSLKVRYAFENHDSCVLFHGARNSIEGKLDLLHSREDIDVGKGFYLGESFEQASSYVFANKKSSVYLFDVKSLSQLKVTEFDVSLEWMLMVCYFRGQLSEYSCSKLLKKIIQEVEESDVIVAPIADNNMYEIMNQFARGDITDKQAVSALSASHLGKQHVLKTEAACLNVVMIDRLYLCDAERKDIENERRVNSLIAADEAKVAISQYRRIGKYVEEILR